MKAKIALITILTDNPLPMVTFYRDVIGFEVQGEVDENNLGYTEFKSEGVRFSICLRSILKDASGHPSFDETPTGQTFELAFPCDSPEDVDRTYANLIAKGASPVHAPETMPWNQRTAMFADPDGHIHEIFADLPK
jgi:uncharacterized glyoxalase superfamily protein PhnB